MSNDKFELVQEITGNSIKPLNHIGQSLALKNGILAFSSITADGAAEKTGAVWVYKLRNNKFEFLEKITPSDASTDDFFGVSIAIDQDILAVGSMRHSPDKLNPLRSGSVYLYSFENDKYYFFNKIYPKESVNDYDYFGSSLDIHNDVLVIGAHSDDEAGKNAGAVYVYNQKGNAWEMSKKITKENANSHNLFGASVSVFDGNFVCSSHLEELDENSIDHGVAYYYNDNSTTSLEIESDPNMISVFPNPTDDFVNISLPSNLNIEKISLFDVTGKEISMINTNSFNLHNNLKEFTVDLKELPNSTYLIIINDKDRSYSFKVIKK